MAQQTPFRFGPDFQYPSKVELLNQNDPSLPHIVLTLCPMSELSTYHIDSLLEYGETGIRNKQQKDRSPIKEAARKKPRKSTKKFPEFLGLPKELRANILELAFLQKHRRVLLTPLGVRIHREETKEILSPLLTSGNVKEALEVNVRPLFKFGPLLINSDKDMIVIPEFEPCSPADFRFCADKIKAIAVSIRRPDFPLFISEFQKYSNLEVVFIILPFPEWEKDREQTVRTWDDTKEHRTSHSKEVMFERIHPNNPFIARVNIPSNPVSEEIAHTNSIKDIRTLYSLHFQMARVVGESRITPHIRYVRLIPDGRVEMERVNDSEGEWESEEERPA